MDNAKRFREYADECRKVATTLQRDQRERVLEIAKAWDECAAAAEAQDKRSDQRPS
jgi:hypothetical protein